MAKSPADLRRMMEKVQLEQEQKRASFTEETLKNAAPRQLPYTYQVMERNVSASMPTPAAAAPKKQSKFRQEMSQK